MFQVINAYLELIKERALNSNGPSVLAFNTFFLGKYSTEGFNAVESRTKNVSIISPNILHSSMHAIVHMSGFGLYLLTLVNVPLKLFLFDCQVDIFSYDLVLVPVHDRNHWTLVVINMREQSLCYYDSLQGRFVHGLSVSVFDFLSCLVDRYWNY